MSNKMKTVVGVLRDSLGDRSKPWYRLFVWVHDRFRVNPIDTLLVAVIALAGFLCCGLDGIVISNWIGFWYPFHVTATLISVPWPADGSFMANMRKADIVEQLSYWLIFAGVLSVEYLIGSLLRLVPFYVLARTGFLVWCFSWNGSTVVRAHFTERLRNLKATLPDRGYPLKVIDAIGDLASDPSKPWYQLFFWAHKRYGMNPFDSLTVAAMAWAALLSCGFDLNGIGNLIGFSYPCHVTIAMMAGPWPADGSDKAKTRKADAIALMWYWLIFASVLFVENIVGFLLRPIPFIPYSHFTHTRTTYSLIKTGFLVWCLSWNGSAVVSAHVLERFENSVSTKVNTRVDPRPLHAQRAPAEESETGSTFPLDID